MTDSHRRTPSWREIYQGGSEEAEQEHFRGLEAEFAARLATAPVRFALHLPRFVSEELTPIEDRAVEWMDRASAGRGGV
ncbi:hypothetical protein [Cryptosporangium phraense]|uniref:Uncharacterized protein n=1 Tax=Cryptosporangium phraense TaxID=2593070 RepID=A0A545AQ28_9ACTN|nr:hypothetical protein [Cryptosporangium phraense]TQS43370.1 hypothetical protein FL583_19245 [Cryptosporangium phraense]